MIYMKLPSTAYRVARQTDEKINQEIRSNTLKRLESLRDVKKDILSERIRELGEEWDTERVLEVSAGAGILVTTLLGMLAHKSWLLLSGVMSVFLIKHAIDGWCPSLPIIRKMGIRTAEEISCEKTVLKIMRGDFRRRNRIAKLLKETEAN